MADAPRIHFRTDKKPSLFFGEREYKFFNDISQELVETVVCQQVKYYAVEEKLINAHPLYGETKNKIYREPISLYARVLYNEPEMSTGQFGIDRKYKIDVYLQKEILWRDLGTNPRVGDYIEWDGTFFEIQYVIEPQIIQGLPEFKFAIICTCESVRRGIFNPNKEGVSDISANNINEFRR